MHLQRSSLSDSALPDAPRASMRRAAGIKLGGHSRRELADLLDFPQVGGRALLPHDVYRSSIGARTKAYSILGAWLPPPQRAKVADCTVLSYSEIIGVVLPHGATDGAGSMRRREFISLRRRDPVAARGTRAARRPQTRIDAAVFLGLRRW
jgi:hypothetical protein